MPPPSQTLPRVVLPTPPAAQANPPLTIAPPQTRAPAGSEMIFVSLDSIVVPDGLPSLANETRRLTTPLIKTRIAVADLYSVAAAIESAYVRAGYPLARVVVPPQRLVDGATAQLRVVDGRIERIDTSGIPARLRPPVRALLRPLVGRSWLTLGTIERRLTLAGQLPGAALRSALAPGALVGGTILVVTAISDPVAFGIGIDNRQASALDGTSADFQVTFNSLLGLGEQIYGFLSFNPSAGLRAFDPGTRRRVAGFGVNAPIADNGLRVALDVTVSRSNPEPFLFRTSSYFQRASLRLSQPLIARRRRSLVASASVENVVERQTAPDFGVSLYEDRYVVGRVGLNYLQRSARSVHTLSATLSRGAGETPRVAPLSRAGASVDYFKLEGQAVAQQALGHGVLASATLRGQLMLSGGPPNSDLFSLDGPEALSPFPAGRLLADEGYTARIEVSRPTSVLRSRASLTPLVYVAAGRGYFRVPTVFDTTHAVAAGVGLEAAAPGLVAGLSPTLTLDWGRQFTDSIFPDRDRLTIAFSLRF